jgi:hypothetical protein
MTRLETISISTNGNPLDINFPILGSALTISLTGAIERSVLYLTSELELTKL